MTANISSIDLYNLLRERVGDQQAKALTDFVEQRVEHSFDSAKSALATKEDLLKMQMELRVEMKEQKSEMIKWMFLFWVGQIGATIGIVLVFLKK